MIDLYGPVHGPLRLSRTPIMNMKKRVKIKFDFEKIRELAPHSHITEIDLNNKNIKNIRYNEKSQQTSYRYHLSKKI